MSIPLERYGMIGDGETAALVSARGSVDWLCLPRFDSPACFASLIGTPDHGHWSIVPLAPITESRQRYEADTLILETDLKTDTGTVRLTDFMPMRDKGPLLVRIVTGLSGKVSIRSSAALRFDYGHMPPWVERQGNAIVCKVGPDEVFLQGQEGAEISQDGVHLRFDLAQGERRVFVLAHRSFGRDADNATPAAPDAFDLLERTRRYWRDWIGRLDGHRAHSDALRRSLLTLKALVHRPTGGLVAAPTTSLPEKPGGSLNWDYRYCWLRDASFTVGALIGCGFQEEAQAWRDWILRAVAGAPDKMGIAYRVDGSRRLDESQLPWLPGYRFAKPVRIGNAAAGQFQLDVYGELMNTLHLCEKSGMQKSDQMRHLERAVADHVSRVWVEPDQGLWESRGEPHHYTYSKVMAWVAIDRLLRGSGRGEL
ncbi:MAG: glycoside hydrolase family 15 protein, partial [Burkholderiaceae bacterium]